MKMLLVVQQLGLGGLPNYVLGLCNALQARGHECRIVHSSEEVPAAHDVAGLVLEYIPGLHVAHGPDDDSSAYKLRDLLCRFRPDVVVVHLMSNHSMLLHLLRSGIPTVRMFHEYTSLCLRNARQRLPGRRCQRALGWGCLLSGCCFGNPRPGSRLPRYTSLQAKLTERRLYSQFGLALVASQYMATVLLKNGFRPERLAVLPYFTMNGPSNATAVLDTRAKASQIEFAGQRTLLFCGQVINPKGLQVLVRALPLLRADCRLIVMGDGNYMPFIRTLAVRLRLEDRIEFRGWLSQIEIERGYQSADIVVVPSIWDEPFGIVGIEAMSSGKPVIAFDVGGISGWLSDEVTGLLVRDISPRGLAVAIDSLLMDQDARKNMGAAAVAVAAQEYGLERHIDLLLDHVSLLIAKSGSDAISA